MRSRGILVVWLAALLLGRDFGATADACCAVSYRGKIALNADQRVIILWDAVAKRQHFIRQASFATDDNDVGFIVPSPSTPELAEAGDEAFATLSKLTEPTIIHKSPRGQGGCNLGCSAVQPPKSAAVKVLEEKRVAGFDAVVLEAGSADELTKWLADHDYAMTPEVAAWAEPYVAQKWKFVALKAARSDGESVDTLINAAALRISFDTDRPLFPYREPEAKNVPNLAARERLLRIYFIADQRYQGELTPESPWTGKAEWAGRVPENWRSEILRQLKLPEDTGPQNWTLTEFADNWAYQLAPADVYFSPDSNQTDFRRPDVIVQAQSRTDGTLVAVVGLTLLLPLWRSTRRLR